MRGIRYRELFVINLEKAKRNSGAGAGNFDLIGAETQTTRQRDVEDVLKVFRAISPPSPPPLPAGLKIVIRFSSVVARRDRIAVYDE